MALLCALVKSPGSDSELALFLDHAVLEVFFQESTTPEARSDFVSVYSAALLTLRDRAKKQLKKEKTISDTLRSTFGSIHAFIVKNFTATAPYALLALATTFFRFFVESEFASPFNKGKIPPLMDIYNEAFITNLIRFTTNNHEDIRLDALHLLQRCPYDMFLSVQNQVHFENSMLVLLSPRGRISDAGANWIYTMAAVHQANGNGLEVIKILTRLEHELHYDLEEIPLGSMSAISLILLNTNEELLESHVDKFKAIINSLVRKMPMLWAVLKPKMANPFEIEDQMDLQWWRALKESTMLLKTLMQLNFHQQWIFFDENTFSDLCMLPIDQLKTVSHRGAFTSVLQTYEEACRICFSSALSEIPMEMLKSHIVAIETHQKLISRRSAGFPSLFTGILNAAALDKTRLKTHLEYAMSELLRVAEIEYTPNSEEENDIPQVHAFNCMRAIIKESKLSLVTSQYYNEVLGLSLQNLNNPTWALKNGALMLFTSLKERLFGSNKMGDIIPGTNAQLFFSKYPGVDKTLMKILTASGEEVNDVIPVLAILSRLRASSAEDGNVQPFLSILRNRFLGHKLWKIREMSASLISSLTHGSLLAQEIEKFLVLEFNSANAAHGIILCVTEMAKRRKREENEDIDALTQLAEKRFITILTEAKPNWIVLKYFLDLLLVLKNYLSSEVGSYLQTFVVATTESDQYPNGPKNLFLKSAVPTLMKSTTAHKELGNVFLNSKNLEVQQAVIDYWTENGEGFISQPELHIQAVQLLRNDSVCLFTKELLVELLSHTNSNLKIEVGNNWTDTMRCTSMLLEAPLVDFAQTLRSYAADMQPDNLRLLATKVAKKALDSNTLLLKDAAECSFILFQKLHDDSEEVRAAAAGDKCPIVVAKLFLQTYISQYGGEGAALLLRELHESVLANLAKVDQQANNDRWDIVDDNLFVDKVQFYEKIVKALQTYPTEVIEQALQICVDNLLTVERYIRANQALLQTWTYNVHLDAAIRMALLCKYFADTEMWRSLPEDSIKSHLGATAAFLHSCLYTVPA